MNEVMGWGPDGTGLLFLSEEDEAPELSFFKRKGHVKTHKKGGHLKPRIEASGATSPGLGLAAPRTVRNKCLLFKPPVCSILYGSQS